MTTLSSTEAEPTPTVPKARPAGGAGSETKIFGRFEPFRATVRVPTGVSSVIVRVAAEDVPGSGVNVTSTAQRVPTPSVAGATGQVLAMLKAAAPAPVTL